LLVLINAVRDIAKIESGQFTLNMTRHGERGRNGVRGHHRGRAVARRSRYCRR
jgi:hypothetical protein